MRFHHHLYKIAGLSLAAVLLANLALAGELRLRQETLQIEAQGGKASVLPLPSREGAPEDGLWILVFADEINRGRRAAVSDCGARILGYVPENSYLVLAPNDCAQRLGALEGVDGLLPYRPAWKLAQQLALAARDALALNLILDYAPDVDPHQAAAALAAMDVTVHSTSEARPRPRLWAVAAPSQLADIARQSGLIWVEEDQPLTDRNDDIRWICQSAIPVETPIWDRGLHGEGQILGHIDSGFEWDGWETSCWFGGPGKVVYLGAFPGGSAGHGFHTAGTLVANGYTAAAGADTTLRGMSYEARLAHSNYQSLSYDLYADLVAHNAAGAHVHSNSWGNDNSFEYTTLCVDIDLFSWDHEDDIVIFAETNRENLRTPENAKNVLAVGATYAGPNFDVFYNGGYGPTADGRRKPEILAPGQAINSGLSYDPCAETPKSGTSMACPAVASGAGLVRQYFTEGFYPWGFADAQEALTPTGALMRAMLLNSSVDLGGIPGYPTDQEGWGRLVLDKGLNFTGEPGTLWLVDQRHALGLETGDYHQYEMQVMNGSVPLTVTLAFSDYPGELAAADPVVNDLNLVALNPLGEYFLGNHFNTALGESDLGGVADSINSVERVIRHDPAPGTWTFIVMGRHVPMGPQGYALVVNGALEYDTPVLLSEFAVAPVGGAVQLSWETSSDSDAAEFRLTASHAGEERRLETHPSGANAYTARDEDPALAHGGEFLYSLYARGVEEGADWQLLRSRSLDLPAQSIQARLLGSYPNPFNPHGTVRFSLAESQRVRVSIHDMAGREVALLTDQQWSAGVHDLSWEGRNQAGQSVASGVYFARLEARRASDSHKLLLLR